jgi:hypothetical protein
VKIDKVFVVEVEVFSNDENGNFVDVGVADLQEAVAYTSKTSAQERARGVNREHVRSVLTRPHAFAAWFSNNKFGDMIDQFGSNTREEMLALAKILCPDVKFGSNIARDRIRQKLNERSDSFSRQINQAQAQWIADTFEFFQIAKVRELKVIRRGKKDYVSMILDLVRARFPQITAAEVYVEEDGSFARVEADGPDGTEYFEYIGGPGTFSTPDQLLQDLYEEVRETIHNAKLKEVRHDE